MQTAGQSGCSNDRRANRAVRWRLRMDGVDHTDAFDSTQLMGFALGLKQNRPTGRLDSLAETRCTGQFHTSCR
jgi:hypothetical protein